MDFVRIARNPWGEEVFLGLAWDVLWLVIVLGALFIVGHAVFARKNEAADGAEKSDPSTVGHVPEKVARHNKSARVSHWILAVAVLALVITAFVPILGLQFPWVTIHWIAGVVFGLYLVYHIVDTVARRSLGEMWIGVREMGEAVGRTRDFFRREEDPAKRPGKWGTENKIFHHITALAGFAVLLTGILMMGRVDTWFWEANPYFLEIPDATWGLLYILHGVAAVGFVGLLMAHIYFAVRPDKLWITRSMFKGWITRDEYLEHHSPERWPVSTNGTGRRGGGDRSGGRPDETKQPAAAAPSGTASVDQGGD